MCADKFYSQEKGGAGFGRLWRLLDAGVDTNREFTRGLFVTEVGESNL